MTFVYIWSEFMQQMWIYYMEFCGISRWNNWNKLASAIVWSPLIWHWWNFCCFCLQTLEQTLNRHICGKNRILIDHIRIILKANMCILFIYNLNSRITSLTYFVCPPISVCTHCWASGRVHVIFCGLKIIYANTNARCTVLMYNRH